MFNQDQVRPISDRRAVAASADAGRKIAVALGLVALGMGLRIWPLQALGSTLAWLTFYPAVMAAALYGGLIAGLSATVLASLAVTCLWFLLVSEPFVKSPGDWLGMSVFVLTGGMLSISAELSRRAQAREKLYHILFDSMDEGFCVIDILRDGKGKALDYRVVEVNPAFERCMGITQALGKTICQLNPDGDSHRIDIYDQVARTGEAIRIKYPIAANQGYYEIFAYRMGAAGSRMVGLVLKDVSERKEAEDRLQHREATFRGMLDTMLEGCQIVGRDWRYIYINDAAQAQNRRPNAELIGHVMMECWPGITETPVFAMEKRCMEQRECSSAELPFAFPDGGTGWYKLTVQPVPEGIVVYSEDVSARHKSEAVLLEREFMLSAIIDNSPSALSLKYPNGRYALANPNLQRILDLSEEQIIGKTDFDLFPEETARLFQINDEMVFRSVARYSVEETLFVDGRLLVYMSHRFPILDEHGKARYVCRISLDITDRKRAEGELQLLNQELENQVRERSREALDLYDQSPCCYHSLSADGTILRANQTELDLMGYTAAEYVGRKITDFMTAEGREVFAHSFPKLLRDGEVRDVGCDFVTKQGKIIPFIATANAVRDEHGNVVSTRSTLIDDTERKAKNQQIVGLNKFLNAVLEVLPFGVAVFDHDYRIVLRNSLFGTLLDYPDELSKKEPLHFSEIVRFNYDRGDFPGRQFDDVLRSYTKMFEDGISVCFERRLGNGVVLEIRGQRILENWTVLTYSDITVHKLAEQTIAEARRVAEAATIAKSAFIANMSHEIRTPLNAIIGLAYLLNKTSLPGNANDMARKIRMAGHSLLSIINDVLDFSKIESGKLDIENTPFRLGDVLDNLSTIMSANAGNKELELIIAPPPSRTNQLIGDALRLEQVLINLAGNAIKFTERGHVALAISVVDQDDARISLRFSVRDTGIGIPVDKQQEIFAPFAQADGSTSRRFGGSGLGLTICRRLVAAMGGDLQVISVPGSGSEFWFILSFERGQDAWLATPGMANLSVLVADDNPIAREVLCHMVEGLGWRATPVNSGEAAVHHVQAAQGRQTTSQILLLDFEMPGMNGLEAANKIRRELPEADDPIIIMVTAHSSSRLLDHADSHVADAVLSKPVTPSTLYNAVAHALRVRQGGEEPSTGPQRLRLAGLRILVVDDSEINRDVAQSIFISEGAQVALADDGSQALDWLQSHPGQVDVVLMDVQMPVMNGYEATRRIRRVPALADLPIIALTAGAFIEQQDLASEAGMSGFISKPFDVDAAVAMIIKLSRRAPSSPEVHDVSTDSAPSGDMVVESDQTPQSLDVARGLGRLGDPALYRRLLRRFVDEYANASEVLLQSDRKATDALLHSLKGSAGTLALEEVSALATALELAYKTGKDPADYLTRLGLALDRAFAAIDAYAPAQIAPETHPSDPIDPVAATDMLGRLLRAWDADRPAPVRLVLRELSAALPSGRLQAVNLALDNFDFRGGETATRMLAEELGLALGE
jgi:PAS domain S-box-containing protein